MSEGSGARRAFNSVRRELEEQRLVLVLLVQRLDASMAAGEWLVRPEDLRDEYERAQRVLGKGGSTTPA